MFKRFWVHQTGSQVHFTPSITSVLDSMEYKYCLTSNESIINISQHIKDGFRFKYQQQTLDFIIQTKLKSYPSEVREECIAYFTSITNEQLCLKHSTDTIVVTN